MVVNRIAEGAREEERIGHHLGQLPPGRQRIHPADLVAQVFHHLGHRRIRVQSPRVALIELRLRRQHVMSKRFWLGVSRQSWPARLVTNENRGDGIPVVCHGGESYGFCTTREREALQEAPSGDTCLGRPPPPARIPQGFHWYFSNKRSNPRPPAPPPPQPARNGARLGR